MGWASLTFGLCACFLTISINIVILVLGIFVNKAGSLYYGNILKVETQEWSKPPVISLIAPFQSTCPNGTSIVQGTFYGINPRCNYISGSYRIGRCRRKEGWSTSLGMPPVNFNRIDN